MSWSSNPLSRFGSSAHAIVVGIISVVVFLTTPTEELWKVYPEPTELWGIMFGIMSAYLAVDLGCMLIMPGKDDVLWLFHHFVGGLGILLIWRTQTVYPVGLYFVMTELSTPWLNVCWMLIKFKQNDTIWFHLASFGLIITFFLFRWFGGVLLWWYIFHNLSDILATHWFLTIYIFAGCGIITLLNVVWGLKLIRKIFC